MSYIVPNIPRSGLGLAHDTRSYLQTLRRREIWQKFEEAKKRGIPVEYDHQMPKDALIKIAVKRNIDLEKMPKSEAPIIGPEPSIHDLRKMVQGLTKDRTTGTKWEWDEIRKLSKDELKGILNDDDAPSGG